MRKKILLKMLLLFFISSFIFADEKDSLNTVIVTIEANERQISKIPDNLKKTAIVDGKILYLVLEEGATNQDIRPEYIIGLIKDQKKGVVEGNITINPLFLQFVDYLASFTISDDMVNAMNYSESNRIALFDQRAENINLPINELRQDIIGIYKLENGKITYEPNNDYTYFSKNGFMKLTPDLRMKIREINNR